MDFLRRNRLLIGMAVCLLLSGGLVLTSAGPNGRDDRLGRFLVDVVAPLQHGATMVADTVGGLWQGITGVFRLRDQVKALRVELSERNRDLRHLREIELENERLRRLLAFRSEVRDEVVTARVIGRDALGVSRSLIINRGRRDGVVKSAAVLAPDGVVGRVIVAGRNASRVLLLTDHNSAVDGIVQRTRARGIVEGKADGGCGLKFVKRTVPLELDDLVVTSGVGGVFPKGLPIGRIVAIERGQGLFQYAAVEPTVDVGVLEEVLVTREPAAVPPAPAPEAPDA